VLIRYKKNCQPNILSPNYKYTCFAEKESKVEGATVWKCYSIK